MPFKIKYKSQGICRSCRSSQVMTDIKGREVTVCHNIHPSQQIPFPLLECNSFEEVGKMTQYEAEKVGWVLETKGTQIIGFKPPQQDK